MCAEALVGQTHTIHFRAFQQEISACGGGRAKRLLVVMNRSVFLRAVRNSHGRGNGEKRGRGAEPRTKRVPVIPESAGNAGGNLLQSLGQGFHQITFP